MATRFVIATLMAMMLPTALLANGLNIGPVSYLYVSHEGSGFVLVRINGTQQGTKPACATDVHRYAFDLSDLSGFAYLAVIQSAMARNQQIAIGGTGTCTVSGNREDVKYIELVVP